MSLIKDFAKLAGVKDTGLEKVVEKQEEDFSPEELKVVRAAVVSTIKQLEKEARETNSPSLTKLYKQDADVYDNILDAVLKGKQPAAARLWANQDTGCRDHIFDNTKDVSIKKVLAKYFGTTLLGGENEEDTLEITESKQLNEWSNNDVKFFVVLTATENSEFDDVLGEVNTMQLKNLILGTPKGEIKDLAIFPESMKQQAHNLAQDRWHDARKAPEEEEVSSEMSREDARKHMGKAYGHGYGHRHRELYGKSHPKNPFKPDTPDYKHWEAEYDLGKKDRDYEKNGHGDEEEELSGRVEITSGPYKGEHGHLSQDEDGKLWIVVNMMGHTRDLDADTTKYKVVKEAEQLDEISKKTLASYAKKALNDVSYNSFIAGKKDRDYEKNGHEDEEVAAGKVEITSGQYKGERGHLSQDEDGKMWIVVNMMGHTRDLDADTTKYKVVKESEQLDELSKKTLASYAKKALNDVSYNSFIAGDESARASLSRGKNQETDAMSKSMDADTKAFKRQQGVEKAVDKLTKESEETKVVPLDAEQGDLEKQAEVKPETEKVPAEVFNDINKMIKEIKFKVDHLSHIDPTFQEHGYYFQFMVLLQQIADMLKQGTDEAFKEATTKLQSFENVALVQVPDSLWKFLSVDMYKPPEKRKGPSLSAKFHEVKKGE